MAKREITTYGAPTPNAGAPYSQGIAFDTLLFVSGQLPVDPTTGAAIEGGIEEQTRRVLANVEAVLHAGGSRLEWLLRTTVYLIDRTHWEPMNRVYREVVGTPFPARTAVVVSELPHGALVEIDAIAHRLRSLPRPSSELKAGETLA